MVYMTQAKNFLKFIYTPREIYSVLDKFGYRPGNSLIKSVVQKGYAEKREHKIVLTKLGKARLKELEDSEKNASIEVQPEPAQQISEPEREPKISLWILGIVGLFGFIVSVFQIASSKIFVPYGIIGILFLAIFIVSVILLIRNSKE